MVHGCHGCTTGNSRSAQPLRPLFSPDERQKPSLVARDNSGQYLTTVSLNGYPLRALIDTGASMVAINQYTAAKLGLNFRLDGQAMEVSTAGGMVRAWRVKFRSVKVGEIEQHDIEGAVIEGGSPTDVLVGMTFLRNLSIRNESNVMSLEARY